MFQEKDNVFNMFYLRMHLRRIAYQHATCNAIDIMLVIVSVNFTHDNWNALNIFILGETRSKIVFPGYAFKKLAIVLY